MAAEHPMKALMALVKERLADQITAVRKEDFFYTVHPEAVPDTVKLPCVGIKDGKITKTDLVGGGKEWTLRVDVIFYDRLFLNNKAIPDLLDNAAAIAEALEEYLLGDEVREVDAGAEEQPIGWLYVRDVLCQYKIQTFIYTKEVY